MIHLFLTPSGDLKAMEKPLHIYSDAPREEDSKMYRAALESAKASAVKVKNKEEVLKFLGDPIEIGVVYALSLRYKMEIEYPCDCAPECTCKCMVAIISPIEEQKHMKVTYNSPHFYIDGVQVINPQLISIPSTNYISLKDGYSFDLPDNIIAEKEETCKWHGNLESCGNETCWDLNECQNSPSQRVYRLKLKEPLVDTGSKEVTMQDLIYALDDKRILKFANGQITPDMWYLSRKQTAEHLLEVFTITRK